MDLPDVQLELQACAPLAKQTVFSLSFFAIFSTIFNIICHTYIYI